MEGDAACAPGKHDLSTILGSSYRDFLVRSNGDQVKVDSLKGKTVGLYFSASWYDPCRRFTPKLVEAYKELHPVTEFEIVFISGDKDDESFNGYFSKMPWLAVPFSDSEARTELEKLFSVDGVPHFVILNEIGEVVTSHGVEIIYDHGAEGYPFVHEHIDKVKEQEEAKKNQSLKSLLVTPSRDYVLTAEGNKVPISEFEGKTVGLYFTFVMFVECDDFTPKLVKVYQSLKEENKNFEIVMIPLDDNEESFRSEFQNMPWLSLPVQDQLCDKLMDYFELSGLPTMVIIGPDGKTLHANAAEAIDEHGASAYPFTPDRFIELEEIEKAKKEAHTLESMLVSKDCDFVIGQDGAKIPVKDLVGKIVVLYFSAHWCAPCRAFLPVFLHVYRTIKAENKPFEVIFISSDENQTSFDEFFSKMPWLALPFEDERNQNLSRLFKVQGIPSLIAIGPTGKTVTTRARELISGYGAKAYPFTEQRIKEIEEEEHDKMAEGWPKKVNYTSHEHELDLAKHRFFKCDGSSEEGQTWSYYCRACDFDLHPKCALDDATLGSQDSVVLVPSKVVEVEGENGVSEEKKTGGGGWICDGEKCAGE